jgi:hypothetical protein
LALQDERRPGVRGKGISVAEASRATTDVAPAAAMVPNTEYESPHRGARRWHASRRQAPMAAKKTAAKKTSAKKNSLVNNINKRKRAGTSRPRSRSTVSKKAYAKMEEGWPDEK